MKKIDYKELARGIALSCYDKAKDNDSNNGITYLDYYFYADLKNLDLVDDDKLYDELMKLRNVIQVEIQECDYIVEVVFSSTKMSYGKYEKILNKKGVI
jgi:hypothetical protein